MATITKELAKNIAKKLGAEHKKKTTAHDFYVIYHQGKPIANFGIRRGSRKELGHDHVPSQIFLRPHDARLLGQCPMSREQWLRKMSAKGLLPQ